MNLSKAAGWVKAKRIMGAEKPFAAGIIGDGSTAEIDTHDAMNAISVWDLPMVLVVTDNGVAISTTPDEGRGIKGLCRLRQGVRSQALRMRRHRLLRLLSDRL